MPRYNDASGIGQTCPKINEVISAIESVEWSENEWWTEKMLVEIMEEIRKANSDLRDWGNDMCRERDDLQDENDNLESRIKDLKSDIMDYKNEIHNLESEISILEVVIGKF